MSKNGLGFVTKEEENKLLQKDQKAEIKDLFKLLYIIHNESYEGIQDHYIISSFLNSYMDEVLHEEGLSNDYKLIT